MCSIALRVAILLSCQLSNLSFAMKGHLEKMECTANKDFVYNYSCSVNKSMGESGSFSGTAYLQPNVTLTRQWVKVSVFRVINNRYVIFWGMNNITIDLCGYLRGRLNSNLMNFATSELKKHSNIFHRCPFKGYNYVQDYLFDFSFYPSNVAEGLYAAEVIGTDRNGKKETVVFHFKLFFNVYRD